MPLRALCAGHGRRWQWPLAAAWAVSVASLLTVALLPRPAAHAYGTFLLAGRTVTVPRHGGKHSASGQGGADDDDTSVRSGRIGRRD